MQLVTFDNEDSNVVIERGNLNSIHISDIHLGVMSPKLQYDILKDQYIDRIKDLPIDVVSIDGDIFDHKSMANSDMTMYGIKLIDTLVNEVIRPKQCTLIIIMGTYTHDCGQLKLFYHYMNDPTVDVRIVETIKFEYVKNAKILCIPELYGIPESVYQQYLFGSGMYDEAYMHGTLQGTVPKDEVGNGRLFTIDDFALCQGPIISGHVHGGGCFKKYFYYCGSPYSWRFDDDYRKGFLICLHNLNNHTHFVHKELIQSFRYETINLDDMISADPKSIINYIDKIKQEKEVDFIRVEFNNELPEDTKMMIDSFYRNNTNVKTKYSFTKEQKFIKERLKEMDELDKFAYINDNSLTEYQKLARYINESLGSVFVTADEIKNFAESDI